MADTVGFYAHSQGPPPGAYDLFGRAEATDRRCPHCGRDRSQVVNSMVYVWCCDEARRDDERPRLANAADMLRRHGYTVTKP